MIRSMTGFGRGAAGAGSESWVVTIQGWNHRHVDLQIRLPEDLRDLEPELRARLQGRVARGRCEVQVKWGAETLPAGELRIDSKAVERFLADLEPLMATGRVGRRLTAGDLSRSPFLARATATESGTAEGRESLLRAFDAALDAFDADRRREGEALGAILSDALLELARIVGELVERRAAWTAQLTERVRLRVDEVISGGAGELPPERLAQEVALLADRSDVREELDRLASHLSAGEEVLQGKGPHGRRLDFWTQEVLRELNTLGAKSRDAAITSRVVDAKVVNERFREQVQNVE